MARRFPLHRALLSLMLACTVMLAGMSTSAVYARTAAPALSFSTYLGGQDQDDASAIALDHAGNPIVVGNSSSLSYNDFPLVGALRTHPTGHSDAIIIKLSADGDQVLFSTYFGGSGNDSLTAVAVDDADNIITAGSTDSPDLAIDNRPVPYTGGAFVAKLSADGQRVLWSTFLGKGASITAIGVGSAGTIALVGTTEADDLPVTLDAVQGRYAGGGCGTYQARRCSDGFIAKLSANGAVLYRSYLGGTADDSLTEVAVDTTGALMLGGTTESANFPLVQPLDSTMSRSRLVVARLNPEGTALEWSTLLGGSYDQLRGMALDLSGDVVVAGNSWEAADPSLARPFPSPCTDSSASFITRIRADGQALVYATFFSGSVDLNDLALDQRGAPTVTGTANLSCLPTQAAFQPQRAGDGDMIVARLSPNGQALEFSSYLGGTAYDTSKAIAVDHQGIAVMVGLTWSNDITVIRPFQSNRAGETDIFVARVAPGDTVVPPPALSDGSFADPAFQRLWARTDQPLAAAAPGVEPRAWVWGPRPISAGVQEPYAEGRDGTRLVQYFDKGRMELGDVSTGQSSTVTVGRLVVEMISGRVQIGDARFDVRAPADLPIVGEPLTATRDNQVTYRSLSALAFPTNPNRAPNRRGQLVTEFLKPGGRTDVARRPPEDLRIGTYNEQLGHNIPQVFLDFMSRRGLIFVNGRLVQGQVIDANIVLGLPLSEPYWVWMNNDRDSTSTNVMFQAFERGVLTYNPANPPAWQVEMGNVGQQYLRWRYEE